MKFLFYFLLLTSIPIFSFAQELSSSEIKQLKKKAINIKVDSTYQNGNWKSLIKAIDGKSIVLLGEFNHGSKEVFLSRNDLIRALHEEAGFDVILFESGIGELAAIDTYREKMPSNFMTLGFFGGWRTTEFEQLMSYVKENNIAVGGFDVQRNGNAFESYLEVTMQEYGIEPRLYEKLEPRFTKQKRLVTNRNVSYDSVQQSVTRLIRNYKRLNKLIAEKLEYTSDEKLKICNQTISNRITYLTYFLQFKQDGDWNKRWAARDLAMAQNVKWLIDNLYSGRNVIVVGHNFHISRFSEKEEVMGEFLKENFNEQMYSLGVFAGTGSYLGNYGNQEELSPPDSTQIDIKDLINTLGKRVHFIDLTTMSNTQASWLNEPIIVNDTFIDLSSSNQLILSEHFDGILLLDQVSTPNKIKWN